MSNNLENDRSITTGKMYPIDLAPQKITIVKSISNADVKMAHLIPGQSKSSGSNQIITHTNAGSVGLMRTATAAQIISSGVASQGTQIVSQGNQLIGQNTQILTQSQLISSSQLLSPGTQIISQGTQLSAQVSNTSNHGNNTQVSVTSTVSGNPVLNVGGQLVSGAGNLVVSSTVRTLPPSVRVLPPIPHHNPRPVLTSVNVSSASGVLVSKSVTSHVPRGLAAGASLAVRPVAASTQPNVNQGNNAWSGSNRGRGALVYGSRGMGRGAPPRQPSPAPSPSHTTATQISQPPHSAIVTLPSSTVLTSSGVISSTVRGGVVGVASGPSTRPKTPTPPPATARPG
ncbi:uncharacterized protein LOC119832499 [Zerene cesonia]|uniref:uncharacterized protein LOC119832499 n=1 Tax=Zerene cesonia TaxID=33412 RepID=UPI0018E4DC29|nr:uncharacterized protein LOC119832499 [Zerene cesonia]